MEFTNKIFAHILPNNNKKFLTLFFILITTCVDISNSQDKASSAGTVKDEYSSPPCEISSPNPNCRCNSVNSGYELVCHLEGTNENFQFHHQPSGIFTIQCSRDSYKDFDGVLEDLIFYMRELKFPAQDVHLLQLKYCPIPDESFSVMSEALNVTRNLETIRIFTCQAKDDIIVANQFAGLPNLKNIYITRSVVEIHKLAFQNLTNLERLIIRGNKIVTLSSDILKPLSNLYLINLEEKSLKALPEDIFSNMKNLQKISLNTYSVSELPKMLFSNLSAVTELNFTQTGSSMLPPGIFDNMTNLQKMVVSGNLFLDAPEAVFENNKKFTSLRWQTLLCTRRNSCNGTMEVKTAFLKNAESLKYVAITGIVPLSKIDSFILPKDLLQGCVSLEEVDISRTRMKSIPETIFNKLTNLRKINLADNSLSKLPGALLRGLKNLNVFDASRNDITFLDQNLFQTNKQLSQVHLPSNQLTAIPQRIFIFNDKLEKLNLSNNRIYFNNNDDSLPTLINHGVLKDIDFSFNHISFDSFDQQWTLNLVALKVLNLHSNAIGPNLKNYFDFIQNGITVDLSNNSISGLVYQNPNNIKNSNFKINLNHNPLKCDCLLDRNLDNLKNEVFKADQLYCAEPEELKNQKVREVDPNKLQCEFPSESIRTPCPNKCNCFYISHSETISINCANQNLESFPKDIPSNVTLNNRPILIQKIDLNMSNNQVKDLTNIRGSVQNFDKIQILDLSNNDIESIKPNDLPKQLKHFEIDNNKITTLSSEVLGLFEGFDKVKLGNNDFECSCNSLQLNDFVNKHHSGKIQDSDSIELSCDSSERAILDLRPSDFCRDNNAVFMTYGLPIVLLLILVCIISVVFMWYQDPILIWLYNNPFFRSFFIDDPTDSDRRYDAFISYSSDDKDYVEEQLVPKLEHGTDLKYDCLLAIRDFVPGRTISDQIVEAVDQSRKTVIVLSKNFCQSDWAQYEFDVAHTRRRAIIVIFGEMPTEEEMGPIMTEYINTHTYLAHDDPWFWEKLRYLLPHRGGKLFSFRTRRRRRNTDQMQLLNGTRNPNFTASNTDVIQISNQRSSNSQSQFGNGHAQNGINGHSTGHVNIRL